MLKGFSTPPWLMNGQVRMTTSHPTSGSANFQVKNAGRQPACSLSSVVPCSAAAALSWSSECHHWRLATLAGVMSAIAVGLQPFSRSSAPPPIAKFALFHCNLRSGVFPAVALLSASLLARPQSPGRVCTLCGVPVWHCDRSCCKSQFLREGKKNMRLVDGSASDASRS